MGKYVDIENTNVHDYVTTWDCNCSEYGRQRVMAVDDVNYLPTTDTMPFTFHWISVEQALPPVEERVLLSIRRHSEYSGKDYAITTCGIYEDGTVDIEDSCWCCDSEWADYDEKTDTCYVPKGWYEYHEYGDTENDGIGFIQPESCSGKITDKVTHWMPMIPNPYVNEVFE